MKTFESKEIEAFEEYIDQALKDRSQGRATGENSSRDHGHNDTSNTFQMQNQQRMPKYVESFYEQDGENFENVLSNLDLSELHNTKEEPPQNPAFSSMRQASGVRSGSSQYQSNHLLYAESSVRRYSRKLVTVVIFAILTILLLKMNSELLETAFTQPHMDCLEKKCFRENILVYNEKTWLNILRNSYHTCTSKPKGRDKVLFKAMGSSMATQTEPAEAEPKFIAIDSTETELNSRDSKSPGILGKLGRMIMNQIKKSKTKGLHFPN